MPEPAFAVADGLRIGYRERGSGPALVLVHGMGGGSGAWATQYDRFSDRYRVIGWDAPGYGGSDDFAMETPTVGDYVDTLAHFLDAVRVEAAHLVGHSFGGILVAGFHKRHPDRVLSLTLAQSVIGNGAMDADERAAEIDERTELVNRLGPDGYARHHAPRSLSPSASAETIARGIEITAWMRPAGYLRQFRALKSANIFDWTATPAVPAMAVRGSDDRTAGKDMVAEIAAAMGGIRTPCIEGIGHMIYLEHPERFNALLEELLGEAG